MRKGDGTNGRERQWGEGVEEDRNVKGDLAEIRFLERVTELGYVACRPFGNHARYDFLVEAAGRISRVQVKSSWEKRRPWPDYRVRVVSGAHRKNRRYEADEIDFVAAYAAPDDAWYIVPVRELPKYHSMRVYPKEGARGRYERYREAWKLLELGRTSRMVKRIWAMAGIAPSA